MRQGIPTAGNFLHQEQTSKPVVFNERAACADLVDKLATDEDEGEVCTALRNAAEAIRNRIPQQRQ